MATLNSEEFEFRIVLLQIQTSLSDSDRKHLHFLFGEDIPRRLQADGSLDTALDALQVLFDRLKVSKDNYDYLVRALEGIQRHDCAERLRSYHKVVPVECIPYLPLDQELIQNEPKVEPTGSTSQIPTTQEIFKDLDDEDIMQVPETTSKPTGFQPPEPDPIDVNGIDLKSFEDSSCEWTKEYSELLHLKYHPRNYQIEIIRDVILNGNSIVCLRTGSGKTFIASVLIKYYFIKKLKTNPNTKFLTLFFVPRKAIRLQQAKAISEIENLKVQICEDDQTIDKLINTNQVIVSTPQKFVNCLKKGTINLSQIDLMIFDECHNTSGGNPYCEIMKFYLCPSRNQNNLIKPLIIGLTATISAKDASEKKDTVDKNLISICGRLACKTISTVCDSKNIEEINQEISRPKNNQFEYVLKVQYNSSFDDYLNRFKNLIQQIQNHLDNHQILDEQEIGSSGYIGQVVILKQSFEKKGLINNIIICDYLLRLTKRYIALKDLPFDMVLKFILQKIEEYYQGYKELQPMNNLLYERCKTELIALLEQHQENPTINSKLNHLVSLLKEYAPTNKKGLILVQTTFYAKIIDDYLSNHPDLIGIVKSTWIVGQNSADHSLTIHEQEAKLKKFRENEANILIATDIVQEGLDIPTCAYVIRYEFVSDEIGTIQSRGRARAQDSAYYLITELDSNNHKREKNNKIREDEMEEAIGKWPTMDKNYFRGEVEKKTKSLIDGWEKEIKEELQQRTVLQRIGKKTGSICCRICSRKLGKLEWLKKRNTTYFINNRDFLINNNCQLDSIYKNFQENLVMGEVECNCGNSLGGCQKYTDRPDLGTLCALKCKQIKFLIEDQMPYIEFKQWKDNNRFDVDELEEI